MLCDAPPHAGPFPLGLIFTALAGSLLVSMGMRYCYKQCWERKKKLGGDSPGQPLWSHQLYEKHIAPEHVLFYEFRDLGLFYRCLCSEANRSCNRNAVGSFSCFLEEREIPAAKDAASQSLRYYIILGWHELKWAGRLCKQPTGYRMWAAGNLCFASLELF